MIRVKYAKTIVSNNNIPSSSLMNAMILIRTISLSEKSLIRTTGVNNVLRSLPSVINVNKLNSWQDFTMGMNIKNWQILNIETRIFCVQSASYPTGKNMQDLNMILFLFKSIPLIGLMSTTVLMNGCFVTLLLCIEIVQA